MKKEGKVEPFGGTLMLAGYVVVYAMTLAPMAKVAALREAFSGRHTAASLPFGMICSYRWRTDR